MDHRHDDAPVVVAQELVEPGDAAGVLQIAQAERSEVLEHLIFQLVAVDHQKDGRLVRLGCAEEHLRRLDHGEGLATALGVPDKAARALGVEGAAHGRLHRAGLVLAQDVFVQLLVLLGKDDVVLQESEHLRDGAEALHLCLQAPGNINHGRHGKHGIRTTGFRISICRAFPCILCIPWFLNLPIKDVPPHRVPAHPVGKADGVGGGEKLLTDEQLGRLAVVTADLVHPQGNRLVLVGVLALDHQHRDAVDEKDHILPRAVVAVVKGPLLGDFVNIPRRIVVIDQDQVALALLLGVEEFAPVAQVLHEFPVAVDVAVEMAELPEQRALGLGIVRVKFPHLGVEQVVEEQTRIRHSAFAIRHCGDPSPPLGFLTGHNRPADFLRVFEDPSLDGFVFGRLAHSTGLGW